MKKIPLTQGKFALVDDCDYEYLNQWKWYAHKRRSTFYAARDLPQVNGKRKAVTMHQVLAKKLGFSHRADHINRDGLDNRRDNLRNATCKQNAENRGMFSHNTSGHKGVCWHKGISKWCAQIKYKGKQIHLGVFDNLEDAINARKEAEKKYFTHA